MRLVIDIEAAPVSWAGAWWKCKWGGIELCIRRDPGHAISRMFIRSGRAAPDDKIVLQLGGKIIDEELIGDAAKRKANTERVSTRLALAAAAGEQPFAGMLRQ